MRVIAGAVTFAFVGLAVTACSIGETRYETIKLPVRKAVEKRTCESPFVVVDLAKAKPCGTDGKSHCFPWAKTSVPKEELEPCDDPAEVCMPDKLLLAGGKKPTECKFGGGAAGACLPLAFKQINQNKDLLQQDACDEDERCVPCIHPIEKVDTGVCAESGVHEADCVGGPGLQGDVETCCAGLGVCMDEKAIPEESRANMPSLGCSAGTLCAPASQANEDPKKCETLAGFDGVCVPLCFAPQLRGEQYVSGDCNAYEICMPCLVGKGQGMLGCD
jgi:hypothetical protein